MNLLDFIILIPLAYFCYRGVINGIIKEVLSIVGIILAVFFAFQYMDPFSEALQPLFPEGAGYLPFLSGLVIFVGTIALVQYVGFLMKKILEVIKLNFINRILGGAFGLLKSGIVVSALLLILAGFSLPSKEARDDSLMYDYVIFIAPLTYDVVAAVYPGAEYFGDTLEQTMAKRNPIDNFPKFD